MKLLIVFLCLMASVHAHALEFDKVQHYAVSVMISEVSSIYFKDRGYEMPRVNAIYFTIGVGIAKELSDPMFDSRDLMFDVLGAVTPALLRWEF